MGKDEIKMIWYKSHKNVPRISKEWTVPAFLTEKAMPLYPNSASFYETAALDNSTDVRSRGELLLEVRRNIRSFHLLWLIFAAMRLLCPLLAIYLAYQGFYAGWPWLFMPPLLLWLPLTIRSHATRYRFYENRIDILTGIFDCREESIWLFQIRSASLTQSWLDWITDTATVWVTFEARDGLSDVRTIPLIGLGSIRFMQAFRDEVSDVSTQQRYLLKGWQIS